MTTVLGIDLAPLWVPWDRRLQMVGVLYMFWMVFAWPIQIMAVVSWMLLNGYAIPVVLYGAWMWSDWDSPNRGSYASRSVQNLTLHKWFARYFPLSVHAPADLLPADQNYLIGFHPHGIISVSGYAFATNCVGLLDRFPHIRFHLCTLAGQFWFPIRREWFMLHGIISCSKESLKFVLSDARKGEAAVLVVGGAEEALDAHPGNHILTLNNRKGFIKLALETGAHLVPCYAFGENDCYRQAANEEGSFVRRFQAFVKRLSGVSPVVFHGRGVFNYNFGLLPFRKELNTVLGAPIPVEKIDHPSQEQIDSLHALYIRQLTNLFDEQKTKYGVPENQKLEIR